jgi:hypothetical protein
MSGIPWISPKGPADNVRLIVFQPKPAKRIFFNSRYHNGI